MADSPTLDADGPIGITIKTDGAAIPDTAQVASVRIRREANRIPEAQVIIETGSIPQQEFGDVDGTTYAIGKDITIAAHYGSGKPATLFSGVIVAQRLRIAEPRGPRLELLCRDKAIALTRGRKSALYAQMKDSDIIAQIASDAGLTAEAASTSDTARDQLRHDATDWDFLRALADRNGHLVLVDAGKITTGPPDTSTAAVLTLTLGEDIIEFDAAANTEGLYATARGLGWDDTAKETVEGQGGALPSLTWGDQTATKLAEVPAKREHLFTTPNRLDAAEIKTMADSRLARSALSAIQGQCSFQGSGRVAPGDMVELKGLGAHFGGNAYVSGVTQVIEHGDWTTRAHLGLPEDWLTDAPGPGGGFAAGITAPIHGLHIAAVLQIHEDPDARLRIKVELPLIGDQPAQVWARIAQPYASGGAGIQFMPEIDDEVVIAFLNSDPNGPVMIGALHNGQTDQPHVPDEENTLKSIVTREQLKVQFDDDKKIITVETPGGHSVTLDDDAKTVTIKDTTGNTVELSENGIKMDSPKDITISATGNIDITAGGDATLSGMNVTANAEMQMTAKGGSAAEFSAGGQTTVKGAMVMIN